MDSNKIDRSLVAGRDIINHSCPFNQSETNIEEMFHKFEKHWAESKPATDHISQVAVTYFVEKNKELEHLVEIYMNAIVDCYKCMDVTDRTRISIQIMEERKKVRKACRK